MRPWPCSADCVRRNPHGCVPWRRSRAASSRIDYLISVCCSTVGLPPAVPATPYKLAPSAWLPKAARARTKRPASARGSKGHGERDHRGRHGALARAGCAVITADPQGVERLGLVDAPELEAGMVWIGSPQLISFPGLIFDWSRAACRSEPRSSFVVRDLIPGAGLSEGSRSTISPRAISRRATLASAASLS